jgi:hypothetical protein
MSLQLLKRYLAAVKKLSGTAPEIQHDQTVAVYLDREPPRVLPSVGPVGVPRKAGAGRRIVGALESLGFDIKEHREDGQKTLVLGFREERTVTHIAAVHYWIDSGAGDEVFFTVSMDLFKDEIDLEDFSASTPDEELDAEAKADVKVLVAHDHAIKALLLKLG